MADFVAVIRKAVDGLANNTPENRAKVYDKARSAVVRQLENMKPRPPEELLNRQILKLDTAIAEVEGEYSEALPAIEEDHDYAAPVAATVVAPVAADISSPYYEETVAEEQRLHQDEPVAAEPYDEERAEPEQQPAHAEYREEPEAEPYVEPEPVVETAAPEPVATHYEPEAPREEASTYFAAPAQEPHYAAEHYEPAVEPEPVAEEDHAHSSWVGQDTPAEDHWPPHTEEPAHQPAEEPKADVAARADDSDVFHENTPLPYAASYSSQSPYYQDGNAEPRQDEQHAADVHFGTSPTFSDEEHRDLESKAETQKQSPAVVEDFSTYFQDTALDLPAKTTPGLPRADNDPFAVQPGQKDDKERTPWDDLEELIGYDGTSGTTTDNANRSNFDSGLAADGIPAAAYRTKKKPRRNYAAMVLVLGGIVLLAGGAYALWVNRDTLNDVVGGLVQSAQTGNTTTPATETASTPAATQTTTPAQPSANGQQPTTQAPPAKVDDGSVTGTKFTQRLLANGTERDEGAGPGANGQPVTAEGQSVYQQNEAAPAAQANPTTGATTAGQTAPAQAPAAAASGHRMFLYEEVLGQTVPTAIEGNVSWSLQNEQDTNGKPSATVQGQITIPGRGLSALITFKRNTDPSLPASHLVEIVFSVGAGFEGGAIDSVQRIAMKSTEQDRGNALIAVPAKITDDFHMIALNDFPDALKTNLELMRTRDWIDIPVSYRNGRRALLTLQKGADGKAAFETALREWSAATPTTGQ
ncbi:hypothetical protein RMR16_010330 [Agrobacterium sp. rho-13.3]|uniref:hypothetical protein n=1 Tax=Agrobacterium sp. rho-13.3 TaxID=3072980 RepID=UPI002A0C9159|nr:hypothetical protein [Agrobacterium sp. rho-13.3]MDX8307840.1 hypothetical protein [Agrobacterium sp. rho-13.3]